MIDDFDELASSYLDGEVTDEEASRVESDPRLLDRVEVLMRVRLASLPPVEPDPEVRRRHLEVAMDAFDRGALDSATGGAAVRGRHLRAIGTPPRRERAEPLRPVGDVGDGEAGTSPGSAAGAAGGVTDWTERPRRAVPRTRWLGAAAAGLLAIAAVGVALGRNAGDAGLDTAMESQADEASMDDDAGALTALAVPEEGDAEASDLFEADDVDSAASASRTVGLLFLDPRPEAADALRAAVDGGLVPDPDTVPSDTPAAGAAPAEDPFGCADLLDVDRALVGVVQIESSDARSYLYVFTSGSGGYAVLVDEECRVLSTSP